MTSLPPAAASCSAVPAGVAMETGNPASSNASTISLETFDQVDLLPLSIKKNHDSEVNFEWDGIVPVQLSIVQLSVPSIHGKSRFIM